MALGIDDPFGSAQRCQIGRERLRVGEGGMIAEELQTAGLPSAPDWLHEVKYDGYRLRVERNGESREADYP
jgi:hypothetical protein